MREIVLDTETTGLNPSDGHRIVEIGCIELVNHLPTGKVYHTYINPERDVPAEASAISGITTEFLYPYPIFSKICKDFLAFLGDSPLVIHNADFDMKFINSELSMVSHPGLPQERAICTLKMARKLFPRAPASLDALCRRFQVDLSERTKHGALLDSELLAKVYLELIGGRQKNLTFEIEKKSVYGQVKSLEKQDRVFREPRSHLPSPEELENHQKLVAGLKNSLWTH